MKNDAKNPRKTPIRERTRLSIVLRLNFSFFCEMAGIFLMLDLALCAAAFVFAAGSAEHTVKSAMTLVSAPAASGGGTQVWLKNEGITAKQTSSPPGAAKIPPLIRKLWEDPTLPGERYAAFPPDGGFSLFVRPHGLAYLAAVRVGGEDWLVSVDQNEPARRAQPIFWTLVFAEGILLFFGLNSRARRIRRTLKPIAELAETARTLNSAASYTPREMEAIAGKLNGINASRLDTRISVDSTQVELKNLAGAINGMLDRINESYRAQVRFVSDASHELRTPIAVIQGYASLLDRWGKNDEKALQESITAIKSETDNMKQLVEQLLFLARGDNDTMILQMERFDLSELAEQVVRETKMIDPAHTFEGRIGSAWVQADEALMKQAMRILVDNAVKYTPAGGKIMVSVGTVGEEAHVTVQDEGIGIAPEAVPRIFDRFFRTDESRARATGGAGLGLSIAHWIAERHGGHMEVLSRENIGTRISLVLPAAEKIVKEEERPEAKPQ